MSAKSCSIAGCGSPKYIRGWCNSHYLRWRRNGDPLGGKTAPGAARKWLDQHKDYAGADCLIWPFFRDPNGYGRLSRYGQSSLVHRVICEHRHGPPPSSMHEAAHTCGAGHMGCVNGGHLQWKTTTENSADKIKHGTLQWGETHSAAKLTAKDVLAIRAMNDISQLSISKIYGVDPSLISHIKRGKVWGRL